MDRILQISRDAGPPLGALRSLGVGDYVRVHPDAPNRDDWPRYWDALGAAFVRGARIDLYADDAEEL